MLKPFSYNTVFGRKASAEVSSLRGEVVDINRNVQTHLNVSGGGSYSSSRNGHATARSQPINVQSSNSVHDDVFIVDDSGTEHHLTLVNWENTGIRKGHHIQVLSVHNFSLDGYSQIVENLNDYVIVNNKSLNKLFYNNSLIKSLAGPPSKDVIMNFIKTSFFPKFVLFTLIFWIIFGFSGFMGGFSTIFAVILIPLAVFSWVKHIKKVDNMMDEIANNKLKPLLKEFAE